MHHDINMHLYYNKATKNIGRLICGCCWSYRCHHLRASPFNTVRTSFNFCSSSHQRVSKSKSTTCRHHLLHWTLESRATFLASRKTEVNFPHECKKCKERNDINGENKTLVSQIRERSILSQVLSPNQFPSPTPINPLPYIYAYIHSSSLMNTPFLSLSATQQLSWLYNKINPCFGSWL